jgi:hypothetical protein
VHGVRRRRRLVSAVGVAAAVALAACTDGGSSQTPTTTTPSKTTATVPGPSASPSKEEVAAQEAKQAYTVYRQTLDRVFQRGGANARADLSQVATGDQLTYLIGQAAVFSKNKWRAVGSPTVRSLTIQDISLNKGTKPHVVLRVCDDATTTDAVGPDGHSIRRPGALAHFIELVTIVRINQERWLVSKENDTPVKTC